MSKLLSKELTVLINANVISIRTAVDIQDFYKSQAGKSQNRLVIMFGILGALLMGLGIILIIAHNWDEMSRLTKTAIAFIPLLIAQILAGFTMVKKPNSVAWRESTTTFLFFAIGASISLVSQIYNIPGDLGAFLQTWSLLCLPLVYLMRSSAGSLLYIIGISWYATEVGWNYQAAESYWYWFMLAAILPFYYKLYKTQPNSNFMTFHNWVVPISLLFTFGTISIDMDELLYVGYLGLLGVFYLIGTNKFFETQKSRNNGYRAIGALGTTSMLLSLSFDWFWKDLERHRQTWIEMAGSPEGIAVLILILMTGTLLYYFNRMRSIKEIKPISYIFLLFIPTFVIGFYMPTAGFVIVNCIILILGLLTIQRGAEEGRLSIMNYGLLILTGLIACRFFDSDISFVVRGVLFMALGLGFFGTNYWMLTKNKNQPNAA